MRSRAFVVGAALYQVVAFAPSTGNGGSRNVFKFLESFKVTD